jgi:hypothetical protein
MTPEAAQQRWCPFARAVIMQGDHPTRAEAYEQTRCVADHCMAWRWSWSPEQAQRYAKAIERMTPVELEMTMPRPKTLDPSGHCGLAGAHGN